MPLRSHGWRGLVLVAATTTTLAAQPPSAPPKPAPAAPAAPESQAGPLAWVDLDRYDVRASRAAFATCDANGDDRLDLLETRRCLPGLDEEDGRPGFRRLDTNRDGFVHWPEFDARYKQRIGQGVRFRFRPARPFTDPAPQATARQEHGADPVDMVMELADTDADPHISRAEFAGLIAALQQPPSAAAFFDVLDTDGSGSLSKAELRPVVSRIPYLQQLARDRAQKARTPASVAGPALEATTLQTRLDRIHPSLGRWHATVFKAADADGDGVLKGPELTTKG